MVELERQQSETIQAPDSAFLHIPTSSQIVEALRFGKISQEQKFAPEIGELFNMRLGRYIDGNVLLSSLRLPNTTTPEGREKIRDLIKISPDLRAAYNSVLARAMLAGYNTVEDIRTAKVEDLIRIKKLGETRGKFLHEMFQSNTEGSI